MEYKFKIQNDRLIASGHPSGFTGNVNTYICHFEIECDIQRLIWFCIFKQGENIYRKLIENNSCIIPQEVLINPEPIYIGCYGTNTDDGIKRISTNRICFDIKQGAYSESTIPGEPTPDIWETLVSKSIPIIGENGNWFVYDIVSGQYIDTRKPSQGSGGGTGGGNGATFIPSISEDGILSWTNDKDLPNPEPVKIVGEDGYTPIKGTDYWTEEDKAEIVQDVEAELDLDNKLKEKQDKLTDVQLANINDIQNIKDNVEGAISEVSMANQSANEAYNLALGLAEGKQDKTTIVYDNPDSMTGYIFNIADSHNKDIRLGNTPTVNVYFMDDVYPSDYIAGLSFQSGETPSSIGYSINRVINWVGTDCTTDIYVTDSGVETQVSIFQPSANTHYDIVFYFNGTQFIGLVNGFKPASRNVVS